MGLEAIKEAIEHLSESERLELESWLAQGWDEQIERDFSPGGAGMDLIAEIDAKIEAGEVQDFKVTRPRG